MFEKIKALTLTLIITSYTDLTGSPAIII